MISVFYLSLIYKTSLFLRTFSFQLVLGLKLNLLKNRIRDIGVENIILNIVSVILNYKTIKLQFTYLKISIGEKIMEKTNFHQGMEKKKKQEESLQVKGKIKKKIYITCWKDILVKCVKEKYHKKQK